MNKGKRGRNLLRFVRNASVVGIIFFAGYGFGTGQFNVQLPGKHKPVASNLPAKLDYSLVDQLYQSIKTNYDGQLNAEQLITGLKHGLAEATGDPYTVYFTPKEAKEFNSELSNTFSGIGAQLGKDKEGNIQVIAPIEGMPAEKAGIRAGDLIAKVNKEDTMGWSVEEAVSKIRGEKGTDVTLTLVRNREQQLAVTITRDDIKIPSVKSEITDENIGYLQIMNFSFDTSELARQAAQDFKDKNVKSVILDLRGNPGGLTNAAVDLASLWLEPGANIMQEKRGGKEVVSSLSASGDNILAGMKTVVLIDGGSASSSEIVAGALADHDAAYLVGTKTYGKGVVQQLINFRDGSQLKVTTSSWYRPSGKNINHKGISPDKTVKLSDKDIEESNDKQLQAAKDYLNQ